ncbi:hypothetical protein BC827DRAFT_909387 [Russula dissimulans]|nr:hypothetical protein BC827DRAFT_909387 [Russula dissimulans]
MDSSGCSMRLHKRGIIFSIGHNVTTSDVSTEAVQRSVVRTSSQTSPHSTTASLRSLDHRGRRIISHERIIFAHRQLSSKYNIFGTLQPKVSLSARRKPHTRHTTGKITTPGLHFEKGQVADLEFERPFYYELIRKRVPRRVHSHYRQFVPQSLDVPCICDPVTPLRHR